MALSFLYIACGLPLPHSGPSSGLCGSCSRWNMREYIHREG
jgi:hypothetical protein